VTPPGDANTVQNTIFRTFCTAETAGRMFYTARRQALIFLVCAIFVKLHFPIR